MNPLPSTPTPRRFLLPKRSSQSSQTPAAPPRFQSTPRFGSSSVSRPTQSRELDIDDDDEEEEEEEKKVDDGSHCSSSWDEEEAAGGRKHDAIDIESDDVTASQEGDVSPGHNSEPEAYKSIEIVSSSLRDSSHASPVERQAKRRKVSISPAPTSDSPREEDLDIPASQDDCSASIEEMEDEASAIMSDSQQSLEDAPDTRTPQQPVFHPAPRFKPIEVDDAFEGLPAAFSPQRRGEKYIAGGLAAELQGWLSEVKGWEGDDGEADSATKIHVEEVRPGKRMYLIRGHTADEKSKRWILAGEGKLTGLGRRAEIRLGSVVSVGQPVWDVELDGDTWTVACDWSVESC